MKIYKIAKFDQESPLSPIKKLMGRFSLYNQEDLDRIEALHLSLGEDILPHILIDQADTVEIWKTKSEGKQFATQYTLSFMLKDRIINEVQVNTV